MDVKYICPNCRKIVDDLHRTSERYECLDCWYIWVKEYKSKNKKK